MVTILRSVIVLAALSLVTTCASYAPPEDYVLPASLEEQSKNLRPIFIKEHNLTLQLPKRWIVKSVEHQRKPRKEMRYSFQDLSGRNTHGLIWILNDPEKISLNVGRYALATMRNMINSYSYSSSANQIKSFAVDVDTHTIHGWHTTVAVLGNFRDIALLYAKRTVAQGPDQWLVVFMRNQGAYRKLDFEKDIKDIAVPIFASFLTGTKDGIYAVE